MVFLISVLTSTLKTHFKLKKKKLQHCIKDAAPGILKAAEALVDLNQAPSQSETPLMGPGPLH